VDYHTGLRPAIRAAHAGRPIPWDSVVAWDRLGSLRKALDRLPQLKKTLERRDGPDDRGNLWWQGRSQSLSPLVFKLCQSVWGEDSVEIQEVLDRVYGGEACDKEKALTMLIHHLNRALLELEAPITFRQKSGCVLRDAGH
jgi:hypothetical protein